MIILIDETQHVVQNKNAHDIEKIRNTLKRLVQHPTRPVWLMLTGLPEVARVIEGDEQNWRRNRYVQFHPLTFEKDWTLAAEMVKFFAKEKAGLDVRAVTTGEQIHRLLHGSLNRLGIAIELVQRAIHTALKAESGSLLPEHLADAFGKLSGCTDEYNVFLKEGDFTAIEVGRFFTNHLDEELAEVAATAAAKCRFKRRSNAYPSLADAGPQAW